MSVSGYGGDIQVTNAFVPPPLISVCVHVSCISVSGYGGNIQVTNVFVPPPAPPYFWVCARYNIFSQKECSSKISDENIN